MDTGYIIVENYSLIKVNIRACFLRLVLKLLSKNLVVKKINVNILKRTKATAKGVQNLAPMSGMHHNLKGLQ